MRRRVYKAGRWGMLLGVLVMLAIGLLTDGPGQNWLDRPLGLGLFGVGVLLSGLHLIGFCDLHAQDSEARRKAMVERHPRWAAVLGLRRPWRFTCSPAFVVLAGAFYVNAAALFLCGVAMALMQRASYPYGITLFGIVSAGAFFVPGWKYFQQSRRDPSSPRGGKGQAMAPTEGSAIGAPGPRDNSRRSP